MKKFGPTGLLALQQTTGRWFINSIHKQELLYTTNLGSELRFSTQHCTRLTVQVTDRHSVLGPSQMWAWRIDGQRWHRASAAHQQFTISCSPEAHLVELVTAGNCDLDQVWRGQDGFGIISVTVDQGELTTAPAQPIIDFIGDSITAGCWVTGKHAALDYRPESNYVGIAGDDLDACNIRIAYSAGGVLRPATGGVPNARHFITHLNATTRWQPDRPSLLVVNLGVNDRRYSVADFNQAYAEFLDQVQQLFTHVPITIMIPFSQSFADQIRHLSDQRAIPVIETQDWRPSYTDGLHLDQAGSIRCGHQLAAVIRPLLD